MLHLWVCRELAGRQLVWFKSNANFQWVNMAPGAQNLPVDLVGEAVVDWFLDNKPLPAELDGSALKILVCVWSQLVHMYTCGYVFLVNLKLFFSVFHL